MPIKRKSFLTRCLLLTLAVAASVALHAQPVGPNTKPVELQGTSLSGVNVDLAKFRGKVVLVFFWSTNCGVCLSAMPELRLNLTGWRGKPFELVTVNVDANMADWKSYEQIAAKTQTQALTAIWTGKPLSQRLPLTLVLDTKGRVLARHEGRVAPEAWDEVADLLP